MMSKLVVSRTPTRISLLGGGSDFPAHYKKYGGAVLSGAIDCYIDVVVKDRFFDEIVVSTSERETCRVVSEIKHNLIREAMKLTGNDWKSIQISTLADIPGHGTGLGSSASVTVGVLKALLAYKEKNIYPGNLADMAYDVEANILGYSTGVQDQLAAAFGGLRYIEFRRGGIDISEPLYTGDLADYLILLYTGMVRNGQSILQPFLNSMSEKSGLLIKITELAMQGREAIEEEDWQKLGYLVDSAWTIKKQFESQVSNRDIDLIYEKAKFLGAWGCKILGAGGGGFFLVIAPKEKREEIVRRLQLRELPFKFEERGSRILFDDNRK